MFYVAAYKPIGARMGFQVMGPYPRERAGLTFAHAFAGTPPSRRDAIRLVAEWFLEDEVPWFSLRGNQWVIDLDALKQALRLPADPDLSDIRGVVLSSPDYDIEETSRFGETKRVGTLRLVFEPATLQEMTETAETRRERLFDEPSLHHELVAHCRQLFVDGHLRQAVLDGCIRVGELVKAKAGLAAEDGQPLMMKAFNPDSPILKLTPCVTNDEKNEQRGYMFLFAGMVQALRNPPAHALLKNTDEAMALEELGFLSLLLRHLDRAATEAR